MREDPGCGRPLDRRAAGGQPRIVRRTKKTRQDWTDSIRTILPPPSNNAPPSLNIMPLATQTSKKDIFRRGLYLAVSPKFLKTFCN